MNIPRHWARASAGSVSCWRSSDTSAGDAEARAQAAVVALAERQARGETLERRYCYTDRPLREQILERHHDGVPGAAILTRNAYGAVVLNTEGVMFVDVDFPKAAAGGGGGGGGGGGWLGRLFGGRPAPAVDRSTRMAELSDLARAWGDEAGGAVRVYETAAGARLLMTDGFYDPAADDTAEIMEAFGADPKYRHLCRVQESFRARLTPKPWRCGIEPMPVTWPHDAGDERAACRWQERYDAVRAAHATCALVDAGSGDSTDDAGLAAVVALHDTWTRATSGRPLA